MAFDTIHTLRTSERLPHHKSRTLAALLDFGACANAAIDNKDYCPEEHQSALQQLKEAGIGDLTVQYVRQLTELECRRPSPGGSAQQFEEVRRYRESIARLSLGMVTATAFGYQNLCEGIAAMDCDEELGMLFKAVMLCQIIDDVLDYSKDNSAGLPSFLTAPTALSQAIDLTEQAAGQYANDKELSLSGQGFPFRLALFTVSAVTDVVIKLGRWRHQVALFSGKNA